MVFREETNHKREHGMCVRDELCGNDPENCPDCNPVAEPQGITPEGQALGHRYVMGNVNCYCPKCSEEQGVCVLDCDYDLDK